MPTSEIHRINENGRREYAGYARFDTEGNFQGTRGGYGQRGVAYSSLGPSRVQNSISNVGARQASRQSEPRRRRVPITGAIPPSQRRARRSRR